MLIPAMRNLLYLVFDMNEDFEIDVVYKEVELLFKGTIVSTGYVHKFIISVNNFEITFEPDEERTYRALVKDVDQSKLTNKDKEIIGLISSRLDGLK